MTENTINKLFFKSAGEHKDNIVFNYFDQTWKTITYNELLRQSKGIASYLTQSENNPPSPLPDGRQAGPFTKGGKGGSSGKIKKGDRVAIVSENRPEWCASYLAISLSSGIAVPIDTQLGSDEIKNLLADSESKVVFHSSKTEKNVKDAARESIALINFDSREFRDICLTPEVNSYPEGSEEDVASIIYTSGTTGIPKGVELTNRNFCSDAKAVIEAEIVTQSDNLLSVLPLHHTYPFMCTFLVPVFLGGSITLPPSLKGPELMSTIKDMDVTILIAVPQLLELIRNGILNRIRQFPKPVPNIMIGILKLCGFLKRNLRINTGKLIFASVHRALGKKFRFFGSGGAKLDPEVMKDLEALGFTVVEGYGLTETSPVVTFNPISKRRTGSAGKPLPSVEIKIIDPKKNEELGMMDEGEITIKGPVVMKGYYRNPEATMQAVRDGWFFSGDLGYIDNEGYLFITGRLKEVIVLGSGKNVYPEDVEKLYMKIPLIKEICVTGAENKGVVESLQAVIVPDVEYAKKAQVSNLQETLKWEINSVSLHMPQYMRIKGYTIYPDPLPRTPLGKLRRFMIKDLLKAKNEELSTKGEDKNLLKDDAARKVVECIKPLLKNPVPIQGKDNLELDLGLDSLARIELVVSLEKAFSIKLPDTFTAEIQTVEELVASVKEYGIQSIAAIEKRPEWKDILGAEPGFDDRKKVGLHHGFLDWLIILIALRLIKVITKIFFRLKVEGIESLPEKGPYIIAPNHTSYLDGFSVVAALPSKSFADLYTLGLQKYFTGRFKESFARLAHVIPIDPETYLNRALQMSSYMLRNGKSLLIFPEGGRSYDGELMEFKKGVGILSMELNVPVVPTCIKGSFEALPKGAIWPKFAGIKVIFGKPLYPSDLVMSNKPEGIDDYQFFANELRERVKELTPRKRLDKPE